MNNDSIATSTKASASCIPATVYELSADAAIPSAFPALVWSRDKTLLCDERAYSVLVFLCSSNLSEVYSMDASMQADRGYTRKFFPAEYPAGKDDDRGTKDDRQPIPT